MSIIDTISPRITPSRFRNPIAKYAFYRTKECIACGMCERVCEYGVHRIQRGTARTIRPQYCIGKDCVNPCYEACPTKALSIYINPDFEALGDMRWTPDLLVSTWYMAETGDPPKGGLEYRVGNSGGGFDRLRFKFNPRLRESLEEIKDSDIDLSVPLNRRNDNAHRLRMEIPFYGGGMSYGSVSVATMVSRIRAAKILGTFCSTGEGGYPEEIKPYDDHVITQVATGLFGVREETIQRVRFMEFKYAQGAKPGLGGHLLGDKVTEGVARMREAVPGFPLFSPFPFHSVYSVEDHKKHVDWIRSINPKIVVSVKVSTPTDVDMVAIGSYYAGAHIIHLDGSYGGTGAAPDIAKKNIAMPIEYAVLKVHKYLIQEGVRDQITIIASGGIRTAHDAAKIIALGADGVCIGTADLVALECIRCRNCESGRGCARGIATTDPELSQLIEVEWGTQRIVNMYVAWCKILRSILRRLGMRSIQELVGQKDCLVHLDYLKRKDN